MLYLINKGYASSNHVLEHLLESGTLNICAIFFPQITSVLTTWSSLNAAVPVRTAAQTHLPARRATSTAMMAVAALKVLTCLFETVVRVCGRT